MNPPSHEELTNQIHRDENQIDAIDNKIENSGNLSPYPPDYASMRSEQEVYRQDILKCMSVLEDALPGESKSSHLSNVESGEK